MNYSAKCILVKMNNILFQKKSKTKVSNEKQRGSEAFKRMVPLLLFIFLLSFSFEKKKSYLFAIGNGPNLLVVKLLIDLDQYLQIKFCVMNLKNNKNYTDI